MPKLPMQSTPGFNSGKNHSIRLMRLSDIKIDPEFSKLFSRNDKLKNVIVESIKANGLYADEPIVLWKGHNILADGHTRYEASIEAGLEEVWVSERNFESREEAMLYAFERQAIRRNLSGPEILKISEMLPKTRGKKGEGRAAERLAELTGLSAQTIYRGHKINREASPEVKQAVKDGNMSIKEAVNTIDAVKRPRTSAKKDKLAELNNSIKTAHNKVAEALNYVADSKCLDMLSDAINCLKAAENLLAIPG
jgi:ParB-like chromosome segregation protein Spo0J